MRRPVATLLALIVQAVVNPRHTLIAIPRHRQILEPLRQPRQNHSQLPDRRRLLPVAIPARHRKILNADGIELAPVIDAHLELHAREPSDPPVYYRVAPAR